MSLTFTLTCLLIVDFVQSANERLLIQALGGGVLKLLLLSDVVPYIRIFHPEIGNLD